MSEIWGCLVGQLCTTNDFPTLISHAGLLGNIRWQGIVCSGYAWPNYRELVQPERPEEIVLS